MPLGDFPWPAVSVGGVMPVWTGTDFLIGQQHLRVASYDSDSSHWSEDLTSLHETEAGRDHPMDRASRRLAVQTMRQLGANRKATILDVGCSTGFVLENLRAALPQADLIGADYLPGPLEGLARRMADIPILQFDLRQCPLPDACVDGITCLNVLEHIDDHERALGHLYRILKPGGLAHIEVPAGPRLYDIYDEYLMHHRRYRLAELINLARAKGFTVAEATHLGFGVYPAFWCVKRKNRRKMAAPPEEKARLVIGQIRRTRVNRLFALMIQLETALGRVLAYPCGIRCVVVLRKA
jgi:ubiquinone/menaquinone biosynthesis C-methylase UbiE